MGDDDGGAGGGDGGGDGSGSSGSGGGTSADDERGTRRQQRCCRIHRSAAADIIPRGPAQVGVTKTALRRGIAPATSHEFPSVVSEPPPRRVPRILLTNNSRSKSVSTLFKNSYEDYNS